MTQHAAWLLGAEDYTPETAGGFGGKAGSLARLQAAGLPVPAWVVIPPQVVFGWLPEGGAAQWHSPETDDATRLTLLEEAVVPPAFVEALQARLATLKNGGEPRFAVRSSALDEDGQEHSFAGQLDSFLFVRPEDVVAQVVAVWRSALSPRMRGYRQERGLSPVPTLPAVLIQRMVPARVAGVAFTVHPVTGHRDQVVVSSVWGLGSGLVSGECEADTTVVSHAGEVLSQQVAAKKTSHRADPEAAEGVSTHDNPEALRHAATLTPSQAQRVAQLALQCAAFYGVPQDIEWALDGEGALYLLQSRPITTLHQLADPDGVCQVWDNSNISESYRGVTTPLTFSFARHAYECVYREFCRFIGVAPGLMRHNDHIFPRMLGLIRGQIYYNLLNWYRLIALLPGFSLNQRFMEQMMGVQEPLAPSLLQDVYPKGQPQQLWVQWLWLARSVVGIVRGHLTLPQMIQAFDARVQAALATTDQAALRGRPLDALAGYYRDLERDLLARWDAPIVNDFLAMIFFGVLRKLCDRWLVAEEGKQPEMIANGLLCGQGDIISVEPARQVASLAALAAQHPELPGLLIDAPLDRLLGRLPPYEAFWQSYQAYLAAFGDRCLEELKLETLTLEDNPLPLLRVVGQRAKRLQTTAPDTDPLTPTTDDPALTTVAAAEAHVAASLKGHWLRRWVFGWVLRNARHRIRDRENLRFKRTQVFGRVRRVFVAMGEALTREGRLADPRDVFYLETTELLGFVEGTLTTPNLAGLVALRKQAFEGFRRAPKPANRFTTTGPVYQGNTFTADVQTTAANDTAATGDRRQGLGCCPGVVRGRARVVVDPQQASLQHGDILVADRTDPGWILLFPVVSGVVVAHGSLLSHSAIVCREMGIPGVVSIPDATTWLADGDWVELNGLTGEVRKLAQEEGGGSLVASGCDLQEVSS